MSIVWKKKVYELYGSGSITEVEVDGNPTTIPNIYEWCAYANGKEVRVIHIADNTWVVEKGKTSGPQGYMNVYVFKTEIKKAVYSPKQAMELAEKWLLE